jgi:hypothetical protein
MTQSRIVKYGMDPELCRLLSTDMTLKQILDKLYDAYGVRISKGDIETYFKYDATNEIFKRYLKKRDG